MNSFITISTVLVVCLITLSCSSDKNKEEDCLSENFKTSFKIRLDVDTHMTDYKDICLDNDNEPETRSAEAWRLRYTVCAYSENGPSDVPVASLSSLSPVIDLTLPLGKYNIIAWADYISDESLNSQYFHTDDFTDILLRDKFSYSGDDTHKIGFIGNENLTVSYRTPELNIYMSPAMAQYKITALDSPDYNVSKVIVSYPEGLPSSLNAISGKISHKWYGVSFETLPKDFVAKDNVFSEHEEIKVPVKIEVYDDRGVLRARRNSIKIPLIKGGVTFVKAKIYSVLDPENGDMPQGGGITIDNEYDDVHIIEI